MIKIDYCINMYQTNLKNICLSSVVCDLWYLACFLPSPSWTQTDWSMSQRWYIIGSTDNPSTPSYVKNRNIRCIHIDWWKSKDFFSSKYLYENFTKNSILWYKIIENYPKFHYLETIFQLELKFMDFLSAKVDEFLKKKYWSTPHK